MSISNPCGNKIIFHYGNLAGLPHSLAKALRNIGQNAISIMPSASDTGGIGIGIANRQLPTDEVLVRQNDRAIVKLFKKLALVIRIIRNGALVHYHGATILPGAIDARIFRLCHIPMIISWGGGDARIIAEACRINQYFYRYDEPEKDRRIRAMLTRVSRSCRFVATDPEMAVYSQPYFEKIFPGFQPIDLETITLRIPDPNNNNPKILHIPTHPHVKGTPHIKNAVEKLKGEGLDFEFVFMEPNLTQGQIRDVISTCDIYVDELRCGSYGVTAVEAMASGKPTLTYLINDVAEKFPPELPLINTNPDTIYDRLKELILDGRLRQEIGLRSREYVEKYHSLEATGPAYLDIYREIGMKG